MFNLPVKAKHLVPPIILIITLIVIELTRTVSMPNLGFYTNLVSQGEYWRIITGQFTHTNGYHLMLNALGLGLVWLLHGEYYQVKSYLIVNLLLLTSIGLLLMFNSPINHHYAGYSAVIHGLIVYGALIDIKRSEKTGWLILLGTYCKVLYELSFGGSNSTSELIGAAVATDAHLYGVLCGTVIGYFQIKKRPL